MGATINLGHIFEVIEKSNFNYGLYCALETNDEDFKGNNGLEYVSKEAIEGRFESDLEYILDEAIKKYGETKKAIEYALRYKFADGYYREHDIEVLEMGDSFIVSCAYIAEW